MRISQLYLSTYVVLQTVGERVYKFLVSSCWQVHNDLLKFPNVVSNRAGLHQSFELVSAITLNIQHAKLLFKSLLQLRKMCWYYTT